MVTGPGVSAANSPAKVTRVSRSSGGIIGIPVSELALGGVAATCFLLLLARLRQAQSARRRIGERAPRPTGEQALVEMGGKAMTSVRSALGRDRNGDLVLSHKTRSGKFVTGALTTWRLFQLLLGHVEVGSAAQLGQAGDDHTPNCCVLT